MEIEFNGLEALTGKLLDMGAQMSGPEARKAVRAGARVIRDAMIKAAPVLDKKTAESTALEPGALKAGIRSYLASDADEPTAIVGPKTDVAHVARWVEYGHRNVKGGYSTVTAKGSRGPGKAGEVDTPAHPFLRPAFESSIEAAETAMKESLSESLKKVQGA